MLPAPLGRFGYRSLHHDSKGITHSRVRSNAHSLPSQEANPCTGAAIHHSIDNHSGGITLVVPTLSRRLPVLRDDIEKILSIPNGDFQHRPVHRHNSRIIGAGIRSVSVTVPGLEEVPSSHPNLSGRIHRDIYLGSRCIPPSPRGLSILALYIEFVLLCPSYTLNNVAVHRHNGLTRRAGIRSVPRALPTIKPGSCRSCLIQHFKIDRNRYPGTRIIPSLSHGIAALSLCLDSQIVLKPIVGRIRGWV